MMMVDSYCPIKTLNHCDITAELTRKTPSTRAAHVEKISIFVLRLQTSNFIDVSCCCNPNIDECKKFKPSFCNEKGYIARAEC